MIDTIMNVCKSISCHPQNIVRKHSYLDNRHYQFMVQTKVHVWGQDGARGQSLELL